MSLPKSGNHMVPDVDKSATEPMCPVCKSGDIEDAVECGECHYVQKTGTDCENCGEATKPVVVCNNCEHTWVK